MPLQTSGSRGLISHCRGAQKSTGCQLLRLCHLAVSAHGRRPFGTPGRRKSAARTTPRASITAPVQVASDKKLTGQQASPAPFWSTFCGCTNGVWVGQISAFSPATGEAEPISLDSKGQPVYHLQSLIVEERTEEGDVILRHNVHRAPALEEKKSSGRSGPISGADRIVSSTSGDRQDSSRQGDAAEQQPPPPWQQDQISMTDEGLVFFDGGSYCLGPVSLIQPDNLGGAQTWRESSQAAPPAGLVDIPINNPVTMFEAGQQPPEWLHNDSADGVDDSAEPGDESSAEGAADDPEPDQSSYAARTASEVEMCLAWGSDQRLRLKLLLSVAREQELDAEVLWMTLARETWEGTLEQPLLVADQVRAFVPAAEAAAHLQVKPQLAPSRLAGEWKLFDLCASPVYETDPVTGTRKRFYMHQGQEAQQWWKPKEGEPGEDGGTFWLPGEAFVEMHMADDVSADQAAHATHGNGKACTAGRGLSIIFGWMPRKGTLISMCRTYDSEGNLQEVRSRTAVAGGWVGGTM